MKIIYTILGTYNSGGMERVLANKANYLSNLGYQIVIVTTDQKSRKPYFDMNSSIQHIDLGINYTDDLGKGFLYRGISYFKKNRLHKNRLKKILFGLEPTISISMFDNDASFITDIKDGSKKILEIHFSRFKRLQYGRKGIWKIIDYFRNISDLSTVKKFDKFVVLTQEDKVYWGNLKNIEVIHNANSFESKHQSTLDQKTVLAVGRYDYQKGFDDLILAWSEVNSQFPDWKLNIYGSGPLKSNYEKLIESLSLTTSVFLQSPTKDIESIYCSHSILAMTSRYEGLPMVLLEGQVCGLPIVSYSCKCGPKDIIKDGRSGFLIEEGDRYMFANKLIDLIRDTSLRKQMGKYSFDNSKQFSEDKIMHKWIELFKEVLNN